MTPDEEIIRYSFPEMNRGVDPRQLEDIGYSVPIDYMPTEKLEKTEELSGRAAVRAFVEENRPTKPVTSDMRGATSAYLKNRKDILG